MFMNFVINNYTQDSLILYIIIFKFTFLSSSKGDSCKETSIRTYLLDFAPKFDTFLVEGRK